MNLSISLPYSNGSAEFSMKPFPKIIFNVFFKYSILFSSRRVLEMKTFQITVNQGYHLAVNKVFYFSLID